MRAKDLIKIYDNHQAAKKVLRLVADTSANGTFLIEVTRIFNETPARVEGRVIKILKLGENERERKDLIYKRIDFGIRNVRLPKEEDGIL